MRSNETRAKNALTMIWIVLLIEVLMVITGFLYYGLLMDIDNGEYVTEETIAMHDWVEFIVALLYTIAMVFSIVTFIKWMRRAYYNLHTGYPRRLSYPEDAAVSSWFIPFVNLYKPYKIMKEIYETYQEILNGRGMRDYVTSTWIIGLWWGVWIFSGIVGNIDLRLSLRAETLTELIDSRIFSIISNLTGIPLALITIRLIKSMWEMESMVYLSQPDPQPVESAEMQ